MILVIVWNIVVLLPEQVYKCSEEKSLQILQYIQSNIYSLIKSTWKQSVSISVFHLLIGDGILKNRSKKQYSNISWINEIVIEFGFTDEIHLNKLFREYRGGVRLISEEIGVFKVDHTGVNRGTNRDFFPYKMKVSEKYTFLCYAVRLLFSHLLFAVLKYTLIAYLWKRSCSKLIFRLIFNDYRLNQTTALIFGRVILCV